MNITGEFSRLGAGRAVCASGTIPHVPRSGGAGRVPPVCTLVRAPTTDVDQAGAHDEREDDCCHQ